MESSALQSLLQAQRAVQGAIAASLTGVVEIRRQGPLNLMKIGLTCFSLIVERSEAGVVCLDLLLDKSKRVDVPLTRDSSESGEWVRCVNMYPRRVWDLTNGNEPGS